MCPESKELAVYPVQRCLQQISLPRVFAVKQTQQLREVERKRGDGGEKRGKGEMEGGRGVGGGGDGGGKRGGGVL